jgi:hypothetical protein
MSETRRYTGSCHCGNVKYEVDLALESAISCNCSICSRSGTLLTFTSPEHFNLLQGEESLQDYKFNKHVINHVFCKGCGIKSFAHGVGPKGPMVAINVRCLEDVDLGTITINQFDGKSR